MASLAYTFVLPEAVPLPNIFPRVLQFDTSDLCNLNCVFCGYHGAYRLNGVTRMPLELVEKIMSEAEGHALDAVFPYCCGDPLLEPRLPEIVRIIRLHSKAPLIASTNGTAYSNRQMLMGFDTVNFSLSAATLPTYQVVHGKPLYHEAVKTIEWLEQQPNHPAICLHFIICPENIRELETWRGQWQRFPQVSNFASENVFDSTVKTQGILEAVKTAKKTLPPGEPCYLWRNCVIRASGDVMMCCRGGGLYGNVAKESLTEVWARRNENVGKDRVCVNCSLKF